MRIGYLSAIAIPIMMLAGCGGSGPLPDMGRVHGKVTLDGQPLPGAVVAINSRSTKEGSAEVVNNLSTGMADANGVYKMYYAGGVEGVRAGSGKIQLDSSSWEEKDDSGKFTNPLREKVPAKYFAPFKDIEIKKGETQEINLELTSK